MVMKRRTFIRNTSYVAFGVSVFGNISWKDGKFVGDTPTTTDILGPFYRPNSPIRIDINPKEFKGERLHLSGIIFKEDGKTPYKNCMVEIWQCDSQKNYDNVTDNYNYRGRQFTKVDGKYHFITVQPVAYPAAPNSNVYRPAHIHMRISGEGQQDLITQIYIMGDTNIENDPCASSPKAINRILKITNVNSNEKIINFNVVLAKEFKPDDSVFEKLSGLYSMNDNSIIEFYREEDLLFMKWNGQIREGLRYKGNNMFDGGIDNSVNFELLDNGAIKVKVHFITVLKKEFNLEGIKAFKYK
jgi:catechol 1,2-dioxygenase